MTSRAQQMEKVRPGDILIVIRMSIPNSSSRYRSRAPRAERKPPEGLSATGLLTLMDLQTTSKRDHPMS